MDLPVDDRVKGAQKFIFWERLIVIELIHSQDQTQTKYNVTQSQCTNQGCDHIASQLIRLPQHKDIE